MKPEFLNVADVVKIHQFQLSKLGGLDGIREPGLLDSAVAQPRAAFGGKFLHKSIFAMAAAYLFHIASNHPFVDGNKRTGLFAALTFLELNGRPIREEHTEVLYEATMKVAIGQLGKDEITKLLRKLAKPR